MKYEYVPAGKYVFKEGDASNDKFYIILSGKISVILKSDANVFMNENRAPPVEEKKSATRVASKEQIREPESPMSALKDEDVKFSRKKSIDKGTIKSLSSIQSTSPTQSLTSLPTANRIRKLSVFARSVVRFSTIAKKKNEVIQETEEEHKQKIKSQVDRLKEIANKASEGRTIIQQDPSDSKKKTNKKKLKRENTLKIELGTINKEMKEGEAFGEKALSSKDAKRSASILTNTDCEFIVVMKRDYINIMGRYNKEDRLKMEFLKNNLHYIDKISSSMVLQDYLYIFHTEIYHRGNTVIEEGIVGKKVYMLVQGQIGLEKKVDHEGTFDCIKSTKSVQVASLFAPATFGEEILFDGRDKYKYTVKVTLYLLQHLFILILF